ncbi:hypothetical protein [Chryseobacterium sp. ON_d1]|uniref:hypothetical protein n=1 Tax=Chryseobacterium sp. ON_d1 TaxID=2583211 RepID=UPI001156EEA0|nr:hypothetical protein [Chryseobacterium sp. ON_d1]GEJ44227.1 hypothetical protein CRS_08350 [Chryseobacterium sp. ON_d1]
MKNNRLGIADNDGTFRVPPEFEESTVEFSESRKGYLNLIPLKKDGIWYYYSNKGQFMMKSDKLCIANISPFFHYNEKFGIYKNGEKYNILYNDGQSLESDYDWISENGILVKNGNNYYFVLQNRTVVPYFKNE